jgi:adenylate kinase
MTSKRIICFLGPQGSGKGTQATRLAKLLSLPTTSTGALYRLHVEQESSIGLEAKGYLDQGLLVTDKLTNQLIKETLDELTYAGGIILDGYPRTLPQKEFLDQLVSKHTIIYIEIDDEKVIQRIAGRIQCPNGHIYHVEYKPPLQEGVCDIDQEPLVRRADDAPELLRARLKTYHESTLPLLEAYKKDGNIHVIHGDQSINEVFEEIKKAFE